MQVGSSIPWDVLTEITRFCDFGTKKNLRCVSNRFKLLIDRTSGPLLVRSPENSSDRDDPPRAYPNVRSLILRPCGEAALDKVGASVASLFLWGWERLAAKAIARVLSFRHLSEFVARNVELSGGDIDRLLHHPHLRIVDLSMSPEKTLSGAVELILTPFDKNSCLTWVNLSGRGMGDSGAETLSQASGLSVLNLENNAISDAGALMLAKNASIISLGLAGNTMTGSAVQEALATKRGLECISLTGASKSALAALLQQRTLRTLMLSETVFSKKSAVLLARNATLRTLAFERSTLKNGVLQIVAASGTLRHFAARRCAVDDLGAIALSATGSLTDIDLSGNSVEDTGAYCLYFNRSIERLNLSDNQITVYTRDELLKPMTWTEPEQRRVGGVTV